MTPDALFTFDAEPIGSRRAGPRNSFRVAGAIAAAVAVASGLVGTMTGSDLPARALTLAAAGAMAAAVALAITVKRLRLGTGSAASVRIALSGESVSLLSAVQTTTIQWQAVRIEERRNDFVFYFLEREPIRVRKAAIGADQGVQRLRSFLMAQAGARAKLLS